MHKSGLEGVVAGTSAICSVNEEREELLYRGYEIGDLVEQVSFEEVAFLLLNGELPTVAELREFKSSVSSEMELPKQVITCLKELPKETDPMDAIKISVGVLGTLDPDVADNTEEADHRKAVRLLAKIPTAIDAHFRISRGKELIKPNRKLSLAGNFLYMLRGKEPDAVEIKALDKSMILYAEHEFNASTFAARVVASTRSDMHSAVGAAIGALKGSLHGGANERVMETLLEIGDIEEVDDWLCDIFNAHRRVMGFGHRVYKKADPRNAYIKNMSRELSKRAGDMRWYDMSLKIEEIMDTEKGMHPNLDFYASSAYYLLGIPIPLYTPIFVASRVTGWTAHIIEQHTGSRLVRPRAEYSGPERRPVVALDDR